ncbi:MAG: hypothetical protein NC433_08095 [Clostridiales bacterium]|nr:hypothetical protein [Clostridiales bacterium]
MSSTKNKTLQQLKLKFSSCCQLHDGMSNVPVFVDKYINKAKIYGVSLSTLKHLSGQLVLLSILIAGIASCYGITVGETVIYIVPYYVVSFLGLYCYFAISSLVDIVGKTNVLRTNLIDFFENHLSSRLEQTSLDLKLIQGENVTASQGNDTSMTAVQTNASVKSQDSLAAAVSDNTVDNHNDNNTDQSVAPENAPMATIPVLSGSEAQELETLLKEFLA